MLEEYLCAYTSFLRGAQLWFHSAHHVAKGTGFMPDHELYSSIYEYFTTAFDDTVEKSIGITNNETPADPIALTDGALMMIQSWGSPVGKADIDIAACALKIMENYVSLTESIFEALEESGDLSLGLNDMLAANSNAAEGFVYKLQQRVKTYPIAPPAPIKRGVDMTMVASPQIFKIS